MVCLLLTISHVGQGRAASSLSVQDVIAKGAVGGLQLEDTKGIKTFYGEHGNTPLWASERDRSQIIAVLRESWRHGLNPYSYITPKLEAALASTHPEDVIPRDVMLSGAIVAYGRDLTGMRVAASSIGQDAKDWRKALGSYSILDRVYKASNRQVGMESLAPKGALYQSLQKGLLAELKAIYQVDPREKVLPLRFSRTVAPGDISDDVLKLRARLGVDEGANPRLYDDRLAKAVMAFQVEHGLKPDMLVGGLTLAALNKTHQDMAYQLVANLERQRWLHPKQPDKYLVVNIPAQTLWAVEGGKIVHEMDVIVGRKERPTQTFRTQVTGVRFNPTWTVPSTIKNEDFLPHLREDPEYLEKRGIQVVTKEEGKSVVVPPHAIDWNAISSSEFAQLHFVQKAGSNNPLGQIRLLMPNPYGIYLHDTDAPNLFGREARAVSSGCVRMSQPKIIAEFVMEGTQGWKGADSLNAILESGKTRDIKTGVPIPVYLLYQTVWPDNAGRLVIGPDIYGWDKKLSDVLLSRSELFIPTRDMLD
ncbi:MAG: murein L,D-transpeptidase [Pseudobdellovibrionaceae bacterium]